MFPLLKKIPPEPRRDFCSGFFDAVNFKPADEILNRQFLGQELLIGDAPVFPGGPEPVHIGKHLVPFFQQIDIHAVIGRKAFLLCHIRR